MKMLMCYNMLTGPKGSISILYLKCPLSDFGPINSQNWAPFWQNLAFLIRTGRKWCCHPGRSNFINATQTCIKCYSPWVWMRKQVHISIYWMGIKIFNIKINENVILRWASLSSLVIIWNYWHIYTIFDLVGFVVCICCALTHMVCVILCWDGFLICF